MALTADYFEQNFQKERDQLRLACVRTPLRKLGALIPKRLYERNLEQNQKVAVCCRHAEEHDVEAFYSCAENADRKIPDIYVFHCNGCGRKHRVFCVGGSAGSGPDAPMELRPFWEVR
jgi:hypothetical protein